MNPDKAILQRTVLLVGDEELLRRRALDGLLASAGMEKDDFDLETFEADVSGLGLTARLSMVLRGQSQAVTLASQGQLGGTAVVTLRRR